MKKIILLGAFLIAFAGQAQDDTVFKSETIEFIKLTGATASLESAIDQIGMMVPDANKATYKKEASATLPGLYGKMAELYMKEFTAAEIKELVAFYKSPLGIKMASKQNSLMQQSMVFGQTWGMELQGIAQKHVGTVNATPEKTN